MHIDEVKANVFLFMAAGYETTSTILAYSTYILATQRNIQEKLQAEIDEHQDKEIDYDLVKEMAYMDLFVREVLRMFPVSSMALARRCNETTTVCGHKIEKGKYALISVHKQKYTFSLFLRECYSTGHIFCSLQ